MEFDCVFWKINKTDRYKRGCLGGIPVCICTVISDPGPDQVSDLEITHHLLESFCKGQQFSGVEVDG